ncbi:FecR family protein [Peristeroidobacter soli]|uniref:FecR family protein n=1 Tax=Peristeroidobacter soli TaxID=2497877 RepID=UPI00101CCC6F|nr:FecR domain-containing protein [Peristeroidobacter soli]
MISNDGDRSSVDRAADEWMALLTSGTAKAEDFAAAREWCSQNDEHRAAFQRARQFWDAFIRPPAAAPAAKPTGLRRPHLAAAACALLVVAAGWQVREQQWTADFRTATGEQKSIALEDGSTVVLDSASALDVHYSATTRVLSLRRGQAMFHVAHDAQRPFVVHDRDVTATALGTVYAVSRLDEGAQVSVLEGRVAVSRQGADLVTLTAGQRVSLSSTGAIHTTIDADSELAWERGMLVAQKRPLDAVLEDLDRYQPGVILQADDLRDLPVSGTFRLDTPGATLGALAAVFPIEITRLTDYVTIVRRRVD